MIMLIDDDDDNDDGDDDYADDDDDDGDEDQPQLRHNMSLPPPVLGPDVRLGVILRRRPVYPDGYFLHLSTHTLLR